MRRFLLIMKLLIFLPVLTLFIFEASVCTLYAQAPLGGDEIAYKAFNRDDGEDAYFKIEMTLIGKRGSQRKRLLDIYIKDYGDLSKNLTRFLSPADIEGTGFLSWENDDKDDTQYLYLPGLGRTRRIVSSQKDMRFVNTDFTYEDMQRRRVEKDTHQLLKEEEWQGHQCYVVEYIPKDKKSSQYSKFVQWIDKESFVVVKAEFYNKKGVMCKRLTVNQLEKIGLIWTAMNTQMEDLKNIHKTRMQVSEVVYNQNLEDEIFTLRNLEDY